MLKIYLLISILLLSCFAFSQVKSELDVLVFSGTYQGKKVFVQNPFDREGVGFSVKHVEVNGYELTGQIFSSAFEIDLNKFNVKIGDSISIHLFYNSDKEPKVINTGSLTRRNENYKLQITDVKVEDDTLLRWSFEDEEEPTDFVIEQYRWNRWIKIGEVKSKGSKEKSDYTFVIPEVIVGENKYRIVQFAADDEKYTSNDIVNKTNILPVEIIGNCKGSSFSFSRPTMFEIFDTYGNIVRRGYSSCPKFCGLEKGLYYINYGSIAGEVFNIKQKHECE